jgi:hypothetical protein
MKKVSNIVCVAVLAAVCGAGMVAASNVHLKGGPRSKPTFEDKGLTLLASGALAGLGQENVLITLAATANPTGNCCNPGGGCRVPGQNPAPVDVTGSASFDKSQIENGNLIFSVETNPPQTPIAGAPDCPNSSWVESITDMSFTSATITVRQAGSVVFTLTCTFSPATSNGTVSSRTVTCS